MLIRLSTVIMYLIRILVNNVRYCKVILKIRRFSEKKNYNVCTTSNFKCCKCHVYVIHEFRAVCPSEEDHESDRWQPFGRPRWRNSTFIHPISCFLISFVCCWHAFLLVVVDMFNFAHAYRVWVAMQQKVSDSKEVKKVKRWKKLVFSNKKWSVSPLCDLYLKIKTGLWFSFKMFCFAFVFYWIALNLSFYRISFLVASFFLISADFCCYLVIISFIWKKKAHERTLRQVHQFMNSGNQKIFAVSHCFVFV